MLLWDDLMRAIVHNKDRAVFVNTLKVMRSPSTVEFFPLVRTAVPIPKSMPVVMLPVAHAPVPAATSPVARAPVTAAATPVVRALVTASVTPAVNEPRTMKYEVDPIILGIENYECLYDCAPNVAKKQMECAEAQRIELLLDPLYKSQGGRSRGWTKGGLETLLKPRCASGGNIRELDTAKRAFPWPIIDHDKLASAFLDFLCVAKKIRVAVWYVEEKRVLLYPAADQMELTEDRPSYPLYHVNSAGKPRGGFKSIKEFLKFCKDNTYTLLPPTSVMSSLSGLTLTELGSVATKLGMTALDGSKTERVAKIATFKLMARLHQS